jgi:hypothetical protein
MGINACCEAEKTGCMGCKTKDCEGAGDEAKYKKAESDCQAEYLKCKAGISPSR